MSAEVSFLRRWSRRKQAAAAGAAYPQPGGSSDRKGPDAAVPPPEQPLPPIETIDAAADVSAFLAPAVPLALARAALRRAWITDPAIRDFVGLSENAWDFNAAGGVPGFGSLDPEEGRRLLARLFNAEDAVEDSADAAAVPLAAAQLAPPADGTEADGPGDNAAPVQPTAPLNKSGTANSRGTRAQRRHGGALPG